MTSRRTTRSGTTRSRRTRNVPGSANTEGCIDLTLDISGDQIIDLTQVDNIIDMSVVLLNPVDDEVPSPRRRVQRGSGRRGIHRSRSSLRRVHREPSAPAVTPVQTSSSPVPSSSQLLNLDSSDDESLPAMPFAIPESSFKANASFIASPPLSITCPVCLDDLKQMRASKKKIMSTVCGHIFCEECIKNAIKTLKKCPTCRKPLLSSKVHPLFI